MGVVFRARDRELGEDVALKTLRSRAPEVAQSLKAEFRSLADIVHPNLVTLYELELDGDQQGFFTMELVSGTGFRDHVRSPAGSARAFDEPKLRAALRQLADGIGALHAFGKLHCDIKPSNVMVGDDGRVVILDFGLVLEVDARHPQRHAGSAPYMSPEQAAARQLTTASDWYAFGALLYEALTGELPFARSASPIEDKQRIEAPHPRERAPDAPDDLTNLCAKLLRRRPASRPALDEILEVLGPTPSAFSAMVSPPRSAPHAFVGRARELATLREAFEEARGGRAATVLIHGVSGIGKSTLVARFVEQVELDAAHAPIVLRGRCYERESMPYKAIDSIVDGLARRLDELAPSERELLLPPEAHFLAKVFPALARPGMAAAPSTPWPHSPRETRRRAFLALGELLRRLGRRAPLVITVDDLQWGDVDSALLLTEVFLSSDPPAALLLLSFRTEDRGTSPLLRLLLSPGGAASASVARAVEIGPLSPEETRALTLALLRDERGDEGGIADVVAAEAGGSPFFVHELTAHSRAGDAVRGGPVPRFQDLLGDRLGQLGEAATRLLEAVAVAGYPLAEQLAARAAGVDRARPTLAALRAARLVLSRGAGGASLVESYHDRVRAAVVERIPEERRRDWHTRLAEALIAAPDADPERIVDHYLGAELPERAAQFAVRAADRAALAFAFHRAASLYRLAVEHGGEAPWELHEKLAESLSNAGRSGDAAASFSRAAARLREVDPADARALALARRASEEFLRSGFVEEGIRALRVVLDAVGARYPESTAEAVALVLLRRAELRLRRPPRNAAPTDADRTLLETYWSAGLGLSMVDTIRAGVFQVGHQALALRTGDPLHLARARASQAAFVASERGFASRKRCASLIADAERIAEPLGDPGLRGLITLCSGVVAYFCNDWRAAVERCASAERTCREHGRGLAWEITNTQIYGLWGLAYLGRIADLSLKVPLAVKEARDRGDVFAATSLRLGLPNMIWLAADRPEEAHEQAADAMHIWTRAGFHSQHYFEIVARAQIDLYRGDGGAAMERVETTWPSLKSSFLLSLLGLRVELLHLRARAALGAASDLAPSSATRRRLLAEARRHMRDVASTRAPVAGPFSDALLGGLAASSGRREDALIALDRAARGFDGLEMRLHAHAARLMRSALAGDNERRDAASAWMRAQGIVAPERLSSMLIPGVR